jgi:hypothetical protein
LPDTSFASDLTVLGTAARDQIAAIGRAGIVARSPRQRVVRPDLVSAAETIVARTARDGEFSVDRGQPVGKVTTPSD